MRVAGMQRLASIDYEKTGIDVIKLSISSLADKVSHLYFLEMDPISNEILEFIQSLNKPFKIIKGKENYGTGYGLKNYESLDHLYKGIDENFDWVLYPDTDDVLPENVLDVLVEADNLGRETIYFYFIECFGSINDIIEIEKGYPIGPHYKAVKHRPDITFDLSPGFNEAVSPSGLKRYETDYCMRHMRYVNGVEKRKSMNYIDAYFLQPHRTIPFKEGEKFNYYKNYFK